MNSDHADTSADERNTRRLVSEVTPAEFGLTAQAGEYERVEAAIAEAVRMVEAGDPVWAAASWCADALDVEREHGTAIKRAVEREVRDE